MSDKDNIPVHVAIIMDGNGRWAREKGLPRIAGHREGAKRVEEAIRTCLKLGVKVLTIFTFSTENWSRPKREIDMLMRILGSSLDRQIKNMQKNNIRFKVIGKNDPLPLELQKKIRKVETDTISNTSLTLVMALNYGSRQEIVDATKRIAKEAVEKNINIDKLSPEDFSRYLYTDDLPDPDLLIRTSGEMRISNFLLWQLSYAELYFPKKYWPDFKEDDFMKAVEVYQKRNRRFGGVDSAVQESN